MNKKGQLTFFIIIGLVILVSIGIFIYFLTGERSAELSPIATIPQEAQEVNNLLSSCIKTLAENGLKKIGEHGGYINQDELLSNPLNPTESASLEFFPGNKVAYWNYLNSDNNCAKTGTCTFSTKQPSLDKIKTDLENYVLKNFETCKQELQNLKEWNFVPLENPKMNVVFTANEVGFYLTYPIRASKGTVTKDLQEFFAVTNLKFKEIFSAAEKIANTEANTGFLGEFMIQLLDYYSGLEPGQLPPFRELTTELGPGKFWLEYEVKNQIKNDLLTNNVQLLQIPNTKNAENFNAPKGANQDAFYAVFTRFFNLPIEGIDSNLEVNFKYLPSWDIYLDLDCPGGLCIPESTLVKNLFAFGLQDYTHVYDISYPTTVFVTDPEAFNGEGYTFKIALEGNIRDNSVLKTQTKTKESNEKKIIASDICDQTKRTSGEITIKVIDASNNKGVNDALISFSHMEDCSMGTTKEGIYRSKFPRAIGGVLSIFKEGYLEEFINLDPDETEQEVAVLLKPLKKIKTTASHYPIVKTNNGWELRQKTEPTDIDEVVHVILSRENFIRSAMLDKNNRFSDEIELAPGKYNVTIQSILTPDPAMIIPPKEYCFRKLINKKCVNIPEKEIVFDKENNYPTGKAKVEIEITERELYNNNNIKFYYFYQDLKNLPQSERVVRDLEVLKDLEDYSQAYKTLLFPTFN
ncbi:hypothetical protein HZA97_00570 [Candidatus Woesearchaeota archaeon]|nr:hypothetical protein [Candidatus Woesearchaeota archaeon]